MTRRNHGLDEEDVGASSFDVRKSAAVERSLAKIRHTLGKDWQKLQDDEIQSLSWILKEGWTRMGFYSWDKINLAAVNLKTTDALIELGRQGRAGKLSTSKSADESVKILQAL